MHLLLKWNPRREVDTLDRHRDVADRLGSTWWGCDTDSDTRTTARWRIDRLHEQLADGRTLWAFVYRLGDAPENADVWKATVARVTDRPEQVDVTRRPTGYALSSSFLFVELSGFAHLPTGWVLAHLEQWDQPGRLLDAGALGNQTSPLFVSVRGSAGHPTDNLVSA